jgi:predicted RNase H-like nuclease (RuvC/YqgF family)
MKEMTVALAIGAGILMTAIAVAIGGLALELVLLAMNRSLSTARVESTIEQAGRPAVIHLKPSENTTGALGWAENAAA